MKKGRRKINVLICFTVIVLLFPLTARQAQSESILLFNTGFDNSGTLLPGGSIDPHYSLIMSSDPGFSGPNTYVSYDAWPLSPEGPWMANDSTSKWISHRPDADATITDGNYIYRTTFDLTGLDLETATITGRWSSDNTGIDILINGISTGNSNPGQFTSFNTFTINDSFVNGLNTLDFVVYNIPFPPSSPSLGGKNPSGLRVELSGNALPSIVPEPVSTILFITGGTLLAGRRLLRRKA